MQENLKHDICKNQLIDNNEGVPDGNNQCFYDELKSLINKYSKENGSNTPDFILARFLNSCLINFDNALNLRNRWYDLDDGKEDPLKCSL